VEQQTDSIVGPVYFFNYLTNMEGFANLNHLSSAQQKHPNHSSCAQLSTVKIIWKTNKKVCSAPLR
jgi:hypothetical protein